MRLKAFAINTTKLSRHIIDDFDDDIRLSHAKALRLSIIYHEETLVNDQRWRFNASKCYINPVPDSLRKKLEGSQAAGVYTGVIDIRLKRMKQEDVIIWFLTTSVAAALLYLSRSVGGVYLENHAITLVIMRCFIQLPAFVASCLSASLPAPITVSLARSVIAQVPGTFLQSAKSATPEELSRQGDRPQPYAEGCPGTSAQEAHRAAEFSDSVCKFYMVWRIRSADH